MGRSRTRFRNGNVGVKSGMAFFSVRILIKTLKHVSNRQSSMGPLISNGLLLFDHKNENKPVQDIPPRTSGWFLRGLRRVCKD